MFPTAKFALVADFCDEVLGFLPEVESALAAFAEAPDQLSTLDPAYRHTHTLKGAATMLGLAPLSNVADRLEQAVEGLAAGRFGLSPELLDLLGAGFIGVREYITAVRAQTEPSTDFLDDLVAGFDMVLPPRPPNEPSLEAQADMAEMAAAGESPPVPDAQLPSAESAPAFPTDLPEEFPLDEAALPEPFPSESVAPPVPEELFSASDLDELTPADETALPEIVAESPPEAPAPTAPAVETPPAPDDPFDPFAFDELLPPEVDAPTPAPEAPVVASEPVVEAPVEADEPFDPFAFEQLDLPQATTPEPEPEPVFDPFGFDDLPAPDMDAPVPAEVAEKLIKPSTITRTANTDELTIFCAEAEEVLLSLESSLTAYQINPANPEPLELAYTKLHNLKGAAGTLGLNDLYQPLFFATDLLLDVASEQVPWTGTVSDTYAELLGAIAGYVSDLRSGIESDTAIFALLEQRLRELRAVPAAPRDLPTLDDLELGADFFTPSALPTPAAAPAAKESTPAPAPAQADIPPELMEIFLEEAEGHIQTIAKVLPQLQKNPSDRDSLLTIRRSVHTLKGAAGMVKFTAVSQLAHRLEDLLEELAEGQRQPTPDVIRLIFASCDALEDLPKGKVDNARLQQLYRDLAAMLDGGAPAALPAPVAAAPVVSTLAAPSAPVVVEPLFDPKLTDTMRGALLQPVVVATARDTNVVRVPTERLDDVVKLLSELVITRTAFELRLSDFRRQLDDLALGAQRLRQVSGKLESEYEASALGRDKTDAPSTSAGSTILPGRTYDFDELEFDRYTEFHLLTRSLGETSNDVQAVGGELGQLGADFETLVTRQARLTSEIEDKLRRLRMIPLAGVVARLSRSVRNAADTLGKQAEFVVEGDRTELDRTVLEELTDPLLHLVRNAVDHGLELPAERRAAGKPEKGSVRLRAYNEGRQVVIELADDGRGVDLVAVRATAVRKGLISAEEAERLSTAEAYNLLLLPGFSTAATITELSGRGVGLDVVRSEVQRLKGTLNVQSERGRGTTFIIRLPLTLAIARCLIVKAHGQSFALPLDAVKAILRLGPTERELVGEAPVARIGSVVYPLVPLGRALHLKQPADSTVEQHPVILLRAGTQDVALQVDHLLGAREVVVKNLGTHLRRVNGISGATLLGDGTVVLILNPAELSGRAAPEPLRTASERPTELPSSTLNILVVDDSPSVRRVMTNILKSNGMQVMVAKDGVEGLETVAAGDQRIDAVLLDVEMPRMDGYEFLRTLRSDPTHRDLPVIMATSRVSAKHKQKAMDLGANDYLVKPFQDEILVGAIRRLARPARGQFV